MGRLEQDNGDGIVENGLAKDERVQLGLYLVRVEDGQNGDWVRGRQRGAHRHGLDKVNLEAIERNPGPEEQDEAENEGGDECACKGKGEDGADMAEEVPLGHVRQGQGPGRAAGRT